MDGDIHLTIQRIILLIGGTIPIIHIVMDGVTIHHMVDMVTGVTMIIIIPDITTMDTITTRHIIMQDLPMDPVMTDTTIVACQTVQLMDIPVGLQAGLTVENLML